MNLFGPLARASLAALLAGAVASPSSAQAPETGRKPQFAFSLANPAPPGAKVNGPLFERVKSALTAAKTGSGSGFRAFLAPKSDLRLNTFVDSQPASAAFTVQTIRAASESCLGPFSFDEGNDWVQLSWICRTDGAGPLARILSFRDSPELSLTVWLKGGLISEIDAREPLPVPGRRLVGMDAFTAMQGKR